jgi:hypothetical protein
VREFVKESGVPAQEAENWDGEAEKLLPIGDGLGSEKTSWGALDSVLEEAGGLEIGLGVDDVVQASVLDPFETDPGYASALVALVRKKKKKVVALRGGGILGF